MLFRSTSRNLSIPFLPLYDACDLVIPSTSGYFLRNLFLATTISVLDKPAHLKLQNIAFLFGETKSFAHCLQLWLKGIYFFRNLPKVSAKRALLPRVPGFFAAAASFFAGMVFPSFTPS